ncbi:MAG: AAA family ATPase [Methylococcales bacterium]
MKLRYLHLGNYPPIKDMAVCFASGSPLQRECAIRFVVGVNGSGKSNLLRAVAEVFLALSEQRIPQFPVSLVYELGVRDSASHRTLILHCPGNRSESSLWVNEHLIFNTDNGAEVFGPLFESLQLHKVPLAPGFVPLIAPGEWPSRATTPPQIALPNAVLAYTTGAMQPWQALWNRSQDSDDVELVSQGEDYDPSAERPAGWSIAQEMVTQTASDTPSTEPVDGDWASETTPANQNLFRRPILLTPALLKCALLAVALPQAFLDTYDNLAELQTQIAKAFGKERQLSPLQELLQRGGWHHLVSVAFRSRLQPKAWPRYLRETAHDWLMCAGEVIAEPHPTEARRTLYFDLKGDFSGYAETLTANDNLQISSTQGEALWALLGGHEATTFELFTKLVELHQAGLFDDVELRLRRQAKPDETSDSDERDNDIGVLRFEELSDGEQMVLSRMALFHLLEGQQDALLLLDEPETHFNDKWKREIVDIIDGAIGKTANDVLISTHSAIVLSDVFNDEIVMVQKTAEGSEARTVSEQTFATDPSALMMTVFEADDSIGKRAQEFIEDKLRKATGTAADIQQLEQLIARMGSGFYRSELRTLLNKWKDLGNA